MDEHEAWPEVRAYRAPSERKVAPDRHGIGDVYPMWETEPQEACFWAGCTIRALPVSFVDGLWLRLCDVHSRAVHHARDEGLTIERRWEGEVHPIVWVAPRPTSTE